MSLETQAAALTEAQCLRIVEMLGLGRSLKKAALAARTTYQVMHARRNSDPLFSARVESARKWGMLNQLNRIDEQIAALQARRARFEKRLASLLQ